MKKHLLIKHAIVAVIIVIVKHKCKDNVNAHVVAKIVIAMHNQKVIAATK